MGKFDIHFSYGIGWEECPAGINEVDVHPPLLDSWVGASALSYRRRVPSRILVHKLQAPAKLVVVPYDAYRASPGAHECFALRGYIIMLVGTRSTASQPPGGSCNSLDDVSKQFPTVKLSSFAAELRNQAEAAHAGVFAEGPSPSTRSRAAACERIARA